MQQIKGACPHDCPDTCAWNVAVEGGRAVAVTGDTDHPFTEGALCSKLKRYPERVYSPDRVLYPQRRVGPKGSAQFERVSWTTALEAITDRLKRVVAEHGPLAAMPHNFAGTIGLLQRFTGDAFFARLGATGVHRDICGTVAYDGVSTTMGTVDGMVPEDLIHSRLIVIWGTNTVATNLHLWSAVIRKARANGARVVAIDPVRTATAASADTFIQIRPGTDAALALGMMHVIIEEGLHDRAYIEQHTLGFDQLVERVADYAPRRVAEITGVSAETVVALARGYATAVPAAIRLSVGMERHGNGSMMMRTVACLPGLTGAWRHRGGGICQFTATIMQQSLNYQALAAPEALPEPARMVHLAQLGRALTDPAMDPPIKWLMVFNSNPLVTAPQQNLTRCGLERDDLFTVVHEHFITDTARYADYLLPATTQLEHLELMPSWGTPYLALNKPAIEPCGEAIPNSELFRRLAHAMGFDEPHLHMSDEDRIRALLASGSPYVEGISYERLERDGWARLRLPEVYQPLADGGFATPSGKIEFYSQTLADQGRDPLPAHVDNVTDESFPLQLISAKAAHFLNSEYVNLRHAGTARHEPTIQLNPEDAAARNIRDGDVVRVFNTSGELEVVAKVSNDTAAGVVFMPFNWWMDSARAGGSPNALTPDGLSHIGIGSNAFDATVEIHAL